MEIDVSSVIGPAWLRCALLSAASGADTLGPRRPTTLSDGSQDWVILDKDAVAGSNPASGYYMPG
jgi:hypothetical protein